MGICFAAALARSDNSSLQDPSCRSYALSDAAMSSGGVRGSDVGVNRESAVEEETVRTAQPIDQTGRWNGKHG
jgi:hypothetical protein